MIDHSIEKALSRGVMEVYELMAKQYPQHSDFFLTAQEYLLHRERLKNLQDIESQT